MGADLLTAVDQLCGLLTVFVGDEWASLLRASRPATLVELYSPPNQPNGRPPKDRYIDKEPLDPWTSMYYQYEISEDGPILVSLGADGQKGGNRSNEDIYQLVKDQ